MEKLKLSFIFFSLVIIVSFTTQEVLSYDYCVYTSGWQCVNGDRCRELSCCWRYEWGDGCQTDWHCSGTCSGGGNNNGGGSTSAICRCEGDSLPSSECEADGTCSGSSNAGICNGEDPIRYLCPDESLNCPSDTPCGTYPDCTAQTTYYRDSDGDTFGDPQTSTNSCTKPEGYVENNEDCDDTNQIVNPDEEDICDGLDNDCDGQIDENDICPELDYFCDDDQDNFFSSSVSDSCSEFRCVPDECEPGPGLDCDDTNENVFPGAEEECDYIDNNCNNEVDEGLQIYYFLDLDNDGYGRTANIMCPGDNPDSYVEQGGDCNDDPDKNGELSFPGNKEYCDDEIDNDCDNIVNENCDCNPGDVIDCSRKGGLCEGYTLTCGDNGQIPVCDWSSIDNYETTEITCDNLDNDCDGQIDEGCDLDKDTYVSDSQECVGQFQSRNGQVYDCNQHTGDCNDGDAEVYPGSTEVCDGLDNNCDGNIDNIAMENIKYCHEVIPGFNNVGACQSQPATCDYIRYKSIGGWFCPLNKFYSQEICNDEIDNDCDGEIDENCPCEPGEERTCGSNIGECNTGTQYCEAGQWSACKNSVSPVDELCDGLDNDCDNKIDEDLTMQCTIDNCDGTSICEDGEWKSCIAECTTQGQIDIRLTNEDIGNFVVDAKLSRNDIKDSINTVKTLNQTLSYNYEEDTTKIKNTISPGNELKDVQYNLHIPKCLSPYLGDLEFENEDYTIIKDDPLIAWHFNDVNERVDLSYSIKKKIPEECLAQVKGMPIARVIGDQISDKKSSNILNKFIIPGVIIFLALGVVLYVNNFRPQKKVFSEEDYKTQFIEKQKENLLKKVKNMKFKTKEQAQNHLKNLGVSDETIDWILKRL